MHAKLIKLALAAGLLLVADVANHELGDIITSASFISACTSHSRPAVDPGQCGRCGTPHHKAHRQTLHDLRLHPARELRCRGGQRRQLLAMWFDLLSVLWR